MPRLRLAGRVRRVREEWALEARVPPLNSQPFGHHESHCVLGEAVAAPEFVDPRLEEVGDFEPLLGA